MKYKRFRKPRCCPNAPARYYVREGDLVVYRVGEVDGPVRHFGRVLGLVAQYDDGTKPEGEVLAVLQLADNGRHAYVRWCALADVLDIQDPGLTAFHRFFFGAPMPAPELAESAQSFGALSASALDRCLREDGTLGDDYRDRFHASYERERATRSVAVAAPEGDPDART